MFSPNLPAILTMKRRIRRTTRRQLRNGKRKMKKKRTCDQQVRNPKRRRKSLEQVGERKVDWLDVPRDIMILIFSKLNTVDLLQNVQFVCSSWLQVAKDRQLFQSIILPPVGGNDVSSSIKLLKDAVDRSCGELMEISLEKEWCILEGLLYVVRSSKSLKRLRLKDWDDSKSLKRLRLKDWDDCFEGELSGRGLVEVCKRAPVLEELELDRVYDAPPQMINEIGESCSQLKYFRFAPREKPCLAYLLTTIARSMPQLRGLHLSFTTITNEGLQAILERCCPLEKLDLRDCFYSDLRGDLVKLSADRIRDLTLPSHRVQFVTPPKVRPLGWVDAVFVRSGRETPHEKIMRIMGNPMPDFMPK